MEEGVGNKKLPITYRENNTVSRPEPMPCIPLIVEIVVIAVPLLIVRVPVRVSTEHGFVFRTIWVTTLRVHENGCIVCGASKLASAKYQWDYFLR